MRQNLATENEPQRWQPQQKKPVSKWMLSKKKLSPVLMATHVIPLAPD